MIFSVKDTDVTKKKVTCFIKRVSKSIENFYCVDGNFFVVPLNISSFFPLIIILKRVSFHFIQVQQFEHFISFDSAASRFFLFFFLFFQTKGKFKLK